MDGMTRPGGVPPWCAEEPGREELPNQVEQLGGLKRLCEQVPVGQDQPATDKILGSETPTSRRSVGPAPWQSPGPPARAVGLRAPVCVGPVQWRADQCRRLLQHGLPGPV